LKKVGIPDKETKRSPPYQMKEDETEIIPTVNDLLANPQSNS